AEPSAVEPRGKKSRKRRGADSIEWNPATKGLDILEDTPAQADDSDMSLSKFEELARRIAETVSKKKDSGSLPLTETLTEEKPTIPETEAEVREEFVDSMAIDAMGVETKELTEEIAPEAMLL